MQPTHLLVLLAALVASACSASTSQASESPAAPASGGFYALETRTLDGRPQPLADFRGKVVLVVNTASRCGLTPQYAGLQQLHEKYRGRGLVVLGFPCNQFRGQEPGTAEEIAAFCTENYGVSFPLMEKGNVLAGDDQSPVYRWLSGETGAVPDWNFAKYLVGRDGATVTFFDARTDPLGEELELAIEAEL